MDEIQKLEARLVECSDTATGIQNKADLAKRVLNVDEQKQVDELLAEFEHIEVDIARRKQMVANAAKLSAPNPRLTEPDQIINIGAGVRAEVVAAITNRGNGLQNTNLRTQQQRERWDFAHMGEFCNAVRTAAVNPSNIDQRLIQNAALSTYGSEGVAADGGFAVPPEWRSQINVAVMGEDSLLSRRPTSRRSAATRSPSRSTRPRPGRPAAAFRPSGTREAAMISRSPSLKDLTIKLHRLTALVPVTEELLEDGPAMGSYVTSKAGEKMQFKVNDAIVNGTGVGQPLGV
jgi:HK97 family phage major capsid protein